MKKKNLKEIFMIIICGFSIWLFSNSVQAAYVSVKASTTSANPGQTVSVTISSDCIGRVNLSTSNGKLSTSSVFIDGAQTVSLTVGNSGTTVVSATPVDMSDSNGNAVSVGGTSTSISIKSASSSTSTSTSQVTSTGTGNNATNTDTDTNKKSSNANLSNLGIRPNDFSGFKAATTSYNVKVPKNVEEVEVYATAQDAKATVSGTGKKQLQEGTNTATITVTAEDGTKKTYTINITRSEESEEENSEKENTEEIQAEGLSELKIGDLELSPNFETNVYEYTVKYIGEDTKLDINATATNPEYIVEITGNEDLKEGENIVTILVSDAEGNNVATYQVTVNKSLVDEEAIKQEQKEKEEKKINIIIGCVASVIVLAIVIFLIIRHRRNKNWAEEYSVPFSGLDYNDNNQLEDFDENMRDKNEEEKLQDEDKENIENNELEDDKETLKEQFLNNYNSDNNQYEDWEEEKPKKRKHKGKRFK